MDSFQQSAQESASSPPRQAVRLLLLLLWGGVTLAAILAAGYSYRNWQQARQELTQLKSNPQVVAAQETNQLIREVSKKIALPEAEQPTVATVTDKEKLKDQPFFVKVDNGDKLLIYPNAKKVYLYRPAVRKVIEVGTFNLTGSGRQPASTAQ